MIGGGREAFDRSSSSLPANDEKGAASPLQIHINGPALTVAEILDGDGMVIGLDITALCEIRNLEPDNVRAGETCRVVAIDNGEPGKGTDRFQLDVTTGAGYTSNIVGDDLISRGNIQAHHEDDE